MYHQYLMPKQGINWINYEKFMDVSTMLRSKSDRASHVKGSDSRAVKDTPFMEKATPIRKLSKLGLC